MTEQESPPPSAADRHRKVLSEVTVEHATAILANGARGALHQLGGDTPELRLATLAMFLFHLCQVEPERREMMRSILKAVSDEVCGDG